MSLLNKESEDDCNNVVHIVNPFVHKLKLDNTFDKIKVRTKNKQNLYTSECVLQLYIYITLYLFMYR